MITFIISIISSILPTLISKFASLIRTHVGREQIVNAICFAIGNINDINCSSSSGNPKTMSNEDIYPIGTMNTTKMFDKSHKEKVATLNQNG